MQLYVAAAVADKGIGPDEYRYERFDTVFGAIFANLISVFIIIATATAIGQRHQPLASAAQAADALKPVAGAGATKLFALGLFGASALAGAVVPLSTAYAVSEAVGVERSVSRRFAEAPLFLSLFTGQVLIGALIALAPGNLVTLLLNTQELNGIITPVILVFILILANRRRLLGDAANGPIFRIVATDRGHRRELALGAHRRPDRPRLVRGRYLARPLLGAERRGQVTGRVDEADVAERLGEVAHQPAQRRVVLLGQQAQIVARAR